MRQDSGSKNMETVFKYCSPQRTDILKNGKIRFTPVSQLNDPFESYPDISELRENLFRDKVNKVTATRGFFPDKSLLDKYWEDAEKHATDFVQEVANYCHVLCLTRKRNNLLMWAHYTNQHEGFVLGFERNSPFFLVEGKFALYEVEYYEHRHKIESLLQFAHHPFRTSIMFLSKSKHWRYEGELRMFGDQATTEMLEDDPNYRGYRFPNEMLTEIILGIRANDKTKEEIKSLLYKYPRAQVFQAKHHPHEYDLEIVPITL